MSDKCFKYITFLTGPSIQVLRSNKLERIHFSFLDAQHDYQNLNFEIEFVKQRQKLGDVIICDDYTTYYNGKQQFPGINKAIDEIIDYQKKFIMEMMAKKREDMYIYLKNNKYLNCVCVFSH